MLNGIRLTSSLLLTVLLGLLPLQVTADDTEIFFSRDFGGQVAPNVLFALDTSGSMANRLAGDPRGRTRLEAMKEAMTGFLNIAENINVGLMRFNGWDGGGAIINPLYPIDQARCGDGFCNEVSISNRVNTPDDDAEQSLSSGEVILNADQLILGQETPTSAQNRVALRFTDLKIPSGATIKSAELIVTSNSDSKESANFQIRAENSDSSSELKAEQYNLSNRPVIGTTLHWAPEEWEEGNSYESPSLRPLIQTVVNKTNWCGGNALTLFIDGSGTRTIHSNETQNDQDVQDNPNVIVQDPTLIVTYDVNNIPAGRGCVGKSLEKTINASSDDARELYTNTRVSTVDNNTDRFFLYRDSVGQDGIMGLRFDDIDIPNDAKILNAYLEFVAVFTGRDEPVVTIKGFSDNNISTFVNEDRNISNRPTTNTSATWTNIPRVSGGNSYQSPNIAPIVQEIINNGGWTAGNALGFRLDGSGTGRRRVESYDSNKTAAPKLFIEYETTEITNTDDPSRITVREELINLTNSMSAYGGTPILGVLHEAASYMRGDDVFYGKTRGNSEFLYRGRRLDQRHPFHRVSHPDSYEGGTPDTPSLCAGPGREQLYWSCREEEIVGDPVYESPIQAECQPNSIVLLSDGVPTNSDDSISHITDVIGTSDRCDGPLNDSGCEIHHAEWLLNTDHASHINNEQNITLHTIGFGDLNGLDYLENLAEAGGGQSFEAVTAEQLRTVFEKIADIESVTSTTFTTPGTAVNQFNRLTNQNSVYFSLFEPTSGPTWPGNLKKYNLSTMPDNTVEIVDANDKPAIDPDTGFFFENAESEWSNAADGDNVEQGGAASRIQVNNNITGPRKVYTYTGSDPADNEDLTVSANQLHESNAELTNSLLSIQGESSSYRTSLLQWSRGVDIYDDNDNGSTSDTRMHMGDPMHSGPLAVNYTSNTGTPTSFVFVTTNEGYLHVIDQETGREVFAFVPQELLENLDRFHQNDISSSHPYGLDGNLSFYLDDTNQNGLVDKGEDALLYFGMRRGGNNYYALDVSDLNKPKLKWVIKGGADGTPGFEELGQTWARAEVAQIQHGTSTRKPVLVMAAGYDQNKDDTPNQPTLPRRPDYIGRGIFIVDALSGEQLWSASPEQKSRNHTSIRELQYSIPSSVRVIDLDGDGNSDQMYVGDTGGQIFRFDFTNDPTDDVITGGLMADFGGNNARDARRFYYPPDMALIDHESGPYLSLGIGSGWRAHPLDDEVQDNFYTLQLPISYGVPDGYGKATSNGNSTSYYPYLASDLLDVTANLQPNPNDITARDGWLIRMDDTGEKVLSGALTLENRILFTTYRPNFGTDLCSVAPGLAQIYAVNAFDGSPVQGFADPTNPYNTSGLAGPTEEDRKQELNTGAIAPSPSTVISEEGAPLVLVGTQAVDGIFSESLTERTWWMEAVIEE